MSKFEIMNGLDILGGYHEDAHGYAEGYDVHGAEHDMVVHGEVGRQPPQRQPYRGKGGMQRYSPQGAPQQHHGPQALAHGPGETGLYRDVDHKVIRKQPAPLPITMLQAAGQPGATQNVTVAVQRIFRIERLMLNSSLGLQSQAVITALNVGQDAQFVNAGAVPVQMFFPTSLESSIRSHTAHPGLVLTISFQNLGPTADTITGAFIGSSVEE